MKSVRIRSYSGPYFLAFGLKRTIITPCTNFFYAVLDSVRKLNLQKSFKRRLGYLLKVLDRFNLDPVSRVGPVKGLASFWNLHTRENDKDNNELIFGMAGREMVEPCHYVAPFSPLVFFSLVVLNFCRYHSLVLLQYFLSF